jgi:Na+-transporting methylmalonyl-CoA/oxaloacetate decarboxylase gamma subunit
LGVLVFGIMLMVFGITQLLFRHFLIFKVDISGPCEVASDGVNDEEEEAKNKQTQNNVYKSWSCAIRCV